MALSKGVKKGSKPVKSVKKWNILRTGSMESELGATMAEVSEMTHSGPEMTVLDPEMTVLGVKWLYRRPWEEAAGPGNGLVAAREMKWKGLKLEVDRSPKKGQMAAIAASDGRERPWHA